MKKKNSECVIALPFKGAGRETKVWAFEEAEIDFRSETEKAARCAVSFAAMELAGFLARLIPGLKTSFAEKPGRDVFSISLELSSHTKEDDSYEISPEKNCVRIKGASRTGVLYGVYHFLRLQGFRWLAPGANNEIAPAPRDFIDIPAKKITEKPSFDLLRGFDFEDPSKESADVLLWMARNRLNLAGARPQTAALAKKLGMMITNGGHIFEKILDPDRGMPSGKILWDEHPEWYGIPASGPKTKALALRTQFCLTAPGLIDFLGEDLVKTINGPWRDADYVDIWGFDTWGSVCNCPSCLKIGNGSDMNLFLLAGLRKFLNKAFKDGKLKHQVRLIGCAYEGTSSIRGPSKPIPKELIEAGDIYRYAPINRCYVHDMADPACCDNTVYNGHLLDWKKAKAGFIMPHEYYNVSKFEDLPLLFNSRIGADLPYYHSVGSRALSYMHFPLACQGPRRLTHLLYSGLLWDSGAGAEKIADDYFADAFGLQAGKIKSAYKKLETAWLTIQQWRSWAAKSILTQLRAWDGLRPSAPLAVDAHFKDVKALIKSGEKSAALINSAFEIINACLLKERAALRPAPPVGQAVNPVEMAKQSQSNSRVFLMEEDRRLIRYGADVMTLMTVCAELHEAWRKDGKAAALKVWKKLEALADSMSLYYIPLAYNNRAPGVDCKDALSRSQLRETLDRCRAKLAG